MQAKYKEDEALRAMLDSVLCYLRAILGAEVKEERLGEILLFGLGHEELRRMSHKCEGVFWNRTSGSLIPQMGEQALS